MSDTRAAMREFRFLDEKRKMGSLSPAEEARWNELRGLLGVQDAPIQEPPAAAAYPQQPQGYYGADGQWYAYPAGYASSLRVTTAPMASGTRARRLPASSSLRATTARTASGTPTPPAIGAAGL